MSSIDGYADFDAYASYDTFDYDTTDHGGADETFACTPDWRADTAAPDPVAFAEDTLFHEPSTYDWGHGAGIDLAPEAMGSVGAMGREGAVTSLMERAYQAGFSAPQEAFDGKVFRGIGNPLWETTMLDHTHGKAGRYNAAGERIIYTSPDPHSVALESSAYARPGESPMANKSLLVADYTATLDAEGRGGVANLREGLRQVGMPVESLTDTKGARSPSWWYQLAGEHPYSLGQQAGKGAADAGASALRGPAATGAADQIDIIPRNTDASQLKPSGMVRFGPDGVPGAMQSAAHVLDMPPNDKPVSEGPLDKRAGNRTGANAANQSPEALAKEVLARASQQASGAADGFPRANSGRYGAAGGAIVSAATDAWGAAHGQAVDLAGASANAATHATLGYGAARATDALTPKLGIRGAGGAVAGIIEGTVSTHTNAQAYRRGEVSAARATANIVVDTTTAVGAGISGAAVGAVVGSFIPVPVAATVVGAAVGFVAGAGAYVAVKYAGEATGALNAAKDKLAGAFAGAERPLGQALTRAGQGMDSASAAASKALQAIKFW